MRRKIFRNFPNEDCLILSNKSVIHPSVPEKKKFIRAHTIVYVIYLRTISPTQTQIVMLSNIDPKGDVPISMLNSAMEKKQEDILEKIVEGCGVIRKHKLKNNK